MDYYHKEIYYHTFGICKVPIKIYKNCCHTKRRFDYLISMEQKWGCDEAKSLSNLTICKLFLSKIREEAAS
jgi:hypothetical protein